MRLPLLESSVGLPFAEPEEHEIQATSVGEAHAPILVWFTTQQVSISQRRHGRVGTYKTFLLDPGSRKVWR